MGYRAEYEDELKREAEVSLLREMYDFLLTYTPEDTGYDVAYKVRRRRGKYRCDRCKFPLGKVRLFLPSATAYDTGYGLGAGEVFKYRYCRPSETYCTRQGEIVDGRELLDKWGVVVGLDAKDALTAYLIDCASVDALTFAEMYHLANTYRVYRSVLTSILGDRIKVRVVRHAGRKSKGLVLYPNTEPEKTP